MPLREVNVEPLSIERFLPLVGEEAVHTVDALAARVRAVAHGRRVWNVNSTAFGGGVAEMLRPLVAYARGLGIDARWVVMDGPPAFFRITKRLHNALHGESGDRSPLGTDERAIYEAVSRQNAAELLGLVRPGDVVLLHDPQTAGLAPFLAAIHAEVVWRCHIGRDEPNPETELGWRFLAPYLAHAGLCVFTRRSYVPPLLSGARSAIVMPSIDPFSPKNAALRPEIVRSILCHTGVLTCPVHPAEEPVYRRSDGTLAEVAHCADIIELGPAPPERAPLVLQVSRWDALKDPEGVMLGFARLCEGHRDHGAHLMLAGPNVHAVADDPDGALVFGRTVDRWRSLPHETRRRVHLVMLPTHDVEENAIIVNALQHHASIVVQKSLREGFGLTVTEAMWKSRPVLASAVGGIRDQIEHDVTGVLLADPSDLQAFADSLAGLLQDPARARRIGEAAHQRVRERFLGLRSLAQYGEIIESIEAHPRPPSEAPSFHA